MRLSYKILLFLVLAALISLSCKTVNWLMQDATPGPTDDEPISGELVFKPEQLPDAQAGTEYSVQVTVEGTRTPVGEFILQEGNYPPGLDLKKVDGEENTAVISGTPTQAGSYKFVIYVWCYGTNRPGQTAEKEYTLVVK